MIRSAEKQDAEKICGIYNHYVKNTVITFEEEPVSPSVMAERITRVASRYPWLVLEREGRIGGYAYATEWRPRAAYRMSAEATVYVQQDLQGEGLGTRLYQELIKRLRRAQFHCVVGGIALPNPTSIAMHEKLGFQKVAEFREVGRKFDRWIDVGYWELIL